MKLLPIIYEGSRTAKEALKKGVVACKIEFGEAKFVVLLDTNRAYAAFSSKQEETDEQPSIDLDKLINRAIVAMIKVYGGTVYGQSARSLGLYQVELSAGVNKFGPLAYQLAMYDTPGWLRSDFTLTKGSFSVWNKMYSMPETYKRKWLGDFKLDRGSLEIVRGSFAASRAGLNLANKMRDNGDIIKTTNEQEFEALLNKYGSSLAEFGNMYAYKLQNPDPKVVDMFDQGESFLSEMVDYGYDYEDIYEALRRAATGFFNRRYSSQR